VLEQLKKGNPAIYTRDYQANLGSIAIDPRPLRSAQELETIYNSIKRLSKGD
ncbi:MAG: SelA-like pyridoxal phosphate-dependent enzyme, partial [Ruminococcaceae bacterium]|nr:SelA-like pyridoxal phosphate-dependent enzyme [Oscillospiraceae bacterium]